jgi:hypothetical protein
VGNVIVVNASHNSLRTKGIEVYFGLGSDAGRVPSIITGQGYSVSRSNAVTATSLRSPIDRGDRV